MMRESCFLTQMALSALSQAPIPLPRAKAPPPAKELNREQSRKEKRGRKNAIGQRDEFRDRVRASERAKAEAEIPDKYLHRAERLRRQAAREAASLPGKAPLPDRFAEMAAIERSLGRTICKREWTEGGKRMRERIPLDLLPPDLGNYLDEPDISCGIICQSAAHDLANLGDTQ